jgi:hypothetical protein
MFLRRTRKQRSEMLKDYRHYHYHVNEEGTVYKGHKKGGVGGGVVEGKWG